MRRPLLIGTLAVAVTALAASLAVAVTALGGLGSGSASGASTMRGHSQGQGAVIMSDQTQSQVKARGIATSWLATNRPDTTIGSIDAYPGYFTVDLKRNGVVSGMMSVSSGSGATWYHTWHGAFIGMEDS